MKRQIMAQWKTHEYCNIFYKNHSDLYSIRDIRAFIDRYLAERAQVIVSLPLIELPYEDCKSAYTLCFCQVSAPAGNIYRRFVKYPFGLFWILEKLRNTNIYKNLK